LHKHPGGVLVVPSVTDLMAIVLAGEILLKLLKCLDVR
jgi:hypothetical protein